MNYSTEENNEINYAYPTAVSAQPLFITTTDEANTSIKCVETLDDIFTPHQEYYNGTRYAIVAVLSTLPCLTIIGNSLVLIAILTHKQLKTRLNIFVASLAVAGLMIALLTMPFGIYEQFKNKRWDLGKDLCLFKTLYDNVLTAISIYSMCCLTIHKYVVICGSFGQQNMTIPRVVVMLFVCWILPISIGVVPVLFDWNHIGIEEAADCLYSLESNSTCVFVANKTFATLTLVLEFYIPAIVMVFCYTRIYKIASRHAHHICLYKLDAHQKRNLINETRAKRTVFAITGCFFICRTPFALLSIVAPFIGYKIPYIVWTVSLWLGHVNSMFNPVLFYKYNRHYNIVLKRILTGKVCRGVSEFEHRIVPSKTLTDLSEYPQKVRRTSDFCACNDKNRSKKTWL